MAMVSSIDVAKHAGVSQTTVSRVLNNPDAVSEKTRLKVLRSIELLNYKPNSIARSLVSNETKTISLISGPLHNPFFVEATSEIVNYCKYKNYNVNVYFEDNENKHDFYQAVFSNKVDGIILSSIFYDDEVYQELVKLKIPFVMLNRRHRKGGNYVEIDNVKAGMLATQHLIDLGHTDILWIGGSLEKSTFKGRFEGYKKALVDNNTPIKTDNVIITDTNEQTICNELEKRLLTGKLPTGIQAATDSIAIFALNFLLNHNIKVPEQISLIGIDGVGISDHASMKISTVSIVNDINMGRVAAEALLTALESRESNEIFIERTYDVELKQRKTTGIASK